MNHLRFQIQYHTTPDQKIIVCGSQNHLGNWDTALGFELQYVSDGFWVGECSFDREHPLIEYKYIVKDFKSQQVFWEGGENRFINLLDYCEKESITLFETYKNPNFPEISFLRTQLFEEVIYKRPLETPNTIVWNQKNFIARFQVTLCGLNETDNVFLLGDVEVLSKWNYKEAIKLQYIGKSTYMVEIEFPTYPANGFNYKYLILNAQNKLVKWEDGPNRFYNLKANRAIFTDMFRARFDERFTGVAVPVFSLRSNDGLGIGEFLDLKLLVDFCSSVNIRLIQILPITDTTCFLSWRDSYPYSSLSVFALHPIYIRLQKVTGNNKLREEIQSKVGSMNAHKDLDYELVYNTKIEYLKKIFATEKDTLSKKEFETFVSGHKSWLLPYAVFCYLRDNVYKSADYTTWNKEHQSGTIDLLTSIEEKCKEELDFYFFVQFHLHNQLKEAVEYGESKRVGLKGDLPIGVNRIGVDSWATPELFKMDMSTGAPPDQFSDDGQNWGFPTYNWEKMKEDGYKWWKSRLGQMSNYFHAFRIDHILGFFRIWEIPLEYESGLMGHYNPSIPIHRHKLDENGIWDIDRLTKPYIRLGFVMEHGFSKHDAMYLAQQFFNQIGDDRYEFRSDLNTEVDIIKHINSFPESNDAALSWKSRVKKCMISLVKNVVLLRDKENPDIFYPRVNIAKTRSFGELEGWLKDKIWNFYIDYYYGLTQEHYWREIGSERLPAIRAATKMLVCGEDLGMVPKCVEPVMNDNGILGLRIQRMPSDSKEVFGWPHSYSYLTVCSPSTHDTSTIRGWWEEDVSKTQYFYNHVLGQSGMAPQFCDENIAKLVILQHLYSPSILAVFALQDFFAIQTDLRVLKPQSEKINEPSNPHHYWKYRIHVTLEELNAHIDFKQKLGTMIEKSGRK